MRAFLRLLRNLAIISGFLAVVAVVLAGTWTFMSEDTRAMLRDPTLAGQATERGLRTGPVNPVTAALEWLRDLLQSARGEQDVLIAADGTSAGIAPLPTWTSTDTSRFFGATETLWQSRRARLAGVRWSRVFFSWSDVQPNSPREWRAYYNLQDRVIKRERDNGVELVGLLINTPRWAAANPQAGVHSPPAGLDRPLDDPQNHWATFVRRMAREYRGRVDTWIVWNEPDINQDDPNAAYRTWAGDAETYAKLLRVAYLAARQGNPNARIVVGATTYWADVNRGQPLFIERSLAALASDPEAARNRFYMDAVGLNLYTSPDDLGRVGSVYRSVLARYGIEPPLWLTETNAVPYDDPAKGLARPQNGLRVTLDQQAAYVVQAFAMGLASGYERMAFHSVMDRSTHDEVWGLIRNDGTLRPAFVAYQTAARYFGGGKATFIGVERPVWRWARGGYHPNWQIYLVSIDRPDGQRVSVVWNGDPNAHRVALPRRSESATLVDKYGRAVPLERDGDSWSVTLPGATAHSPFDPEGYYFIGGDPLLLVEVGVAADTPVVAPRIAD